MNPTAPTQTAQDSDTSIASTAFVNAEIVADLDTSAELKAILTDETGSGGLAVFATSPTITTPVLAGATLNNNTQLTLNDSGGSSNGKILVDSSFNLLRISAASANVVDITNQAASKYLRLRGEKLVGVGTAPGTITSGCGNTASLVGNDTAGLITIAGTGLGTTCGFTFNASWTTNRPICVAGFDNNGSAKTISEAESTTTTLLIATSATLQSGDILAYHCVGRE